MAELQCSTLGSESEKPLQPCNTKQLSICLIYECRQKIIPRPALSGARGVLQGVSVPFTATARRKAELYLAIKVDRDTSVALNCSRHSGLAGLIQGCKSLTSCSLPTLSGIDGGGESGDKCNIEVRKYRESFSRISDRNRLPSFRCIGLADRLHCVV
ncbi:hypothetical protein J6590_082094 [Homalodisca vitripennis]|nr:hypothetical protein J6590_082094 [Homalodisca vitripennis]